MHLLNHPDPAHAQQERSLFNSKEPSPTITAAEGSFTIEVDLVLNEHNVHIRTSTIIFQMMDKFSLLNYFI